MTLKEFFDKRHERDIHIFIGNEYDTTEFEDETSELHTYLNEKTEQYEIVEFDFYNMVGKYPALAIYVNVHKRSKK